MSNNVNVDGKLQMKNKLKEPNVHGVFLLDNPTLFDDFLQRADDNTNLLEESLDGTSDTFAINAAANGTARLTTGTGDTEETIINYGQLTWYGDYNCIFECRLKAVDVSGVGVFVGLADATGEMSADYKSGTLTYTAGDVCGFLFDAGKGSSSIYCVGSMAGSEEDAQDTGTDAEDDTYYTFRMELSGDTVTFYLNGAAVGYMAEGVTGDTALIATVSVENRDASQDYVDIDYIFVTQDRQD